MGTELGTTFRPSDLVREITFVGDSHTDAIRAALVSGLVSAPANLRLLVKRRINPQKPSIGGDIHEDAIPGFAERARQADLIVLQLRGNQFNTLCLLQHPVPFDFEIRHPDIAPELHDVVLIPNALLRDYFDQTLKAGYGKVLKDIAERSNATVYCLAPPSPKRDHTFIIQNAEKVFKSLDIGRVGVTPASVRLKMWIMQNQSLEALCESLGIRFLWMPPGTTDDHGYLLEEYYARDATHGNAAYGACVVRQIIDQALKEQNES